MFPPFFFSPVRVQQSVNVRKTSCWRATSSWSCSYVSSTAAGSCTRNTWSSVRRTAPPGSSLPSWRRSWETQREPAVSSSSPSDNRDSTCQRYWLHVCSYNHLLLTKEIPLHSVLSFFVISIPLLKEGSPALHHLFIINMYYAVGSVTFSQTDKLKLLYKGCSLFCTYKLICWSFQNVCVCYLFRCCGSPTLTLKLSRRSMETPETFTKGCCSARSMSRWEQHFSFLCSLNIWQDKMLKTFLSCRFGSATPSSSCPSTAPTGCRSAGRSLRRPTRAWGTARRRRSVWCCSSPGATSRRSSDPTARWREWGSCYRRRWRRGGSWRPRTG